MHDSPIDAEAAAEIARDLATSSRNRSSGLYLAPLSLQFVRAEQANQ